MTKINDKPEGQVIDLPLGNAVTDQAAAWVAALDADPVSRATLKAFRQWVNAAPEHAAEFERLAKRWESLNILTQITVPSEYQREHRTASGQASWLGNWLPGPQGVLAMAVTLVAVLALLVIPINNENSKLYATAIGEQKTIVLSDNSRIQLNTNTRLTIDYSEQRRGIHLLQGEAYFQVAHNPQRPFEVYSGAGVVRAIGTAFSVHLNHQQIEVLVNEGVVEVDEMPTIPAQAQAAALSTTLDSSSVTSSTTPPSRPRISAGTRATFERHQPLQLALDETVEMDKQLAWRNGALVFRQEPLQALVDEVSRYTSTRIVITDNALRALLVGGVFEVGNTDAVLDALTLGFGIQVNRIDEQLVYLSPANSQNSPKK